jgi:hypothetical protein
VASATFAIPSFLGGEISDFAQGRFDKPDYRISLNVCLNSFSVEIGPWTRRPGTMDAGTTLNGNPGRVMEFEIEEQAALTLEFTDGNLRFRSGATLVPTVFGGATPLVLATPYIGGSWNSSNMRGVQAETTEILLNPLIPPQALVVTTLPSATIAPSFTLNPAIFNDGPYLDPFTNGVQATPGSTSGIVTIQLGFAAYSATTAYANGAFVTSGGICYESLQDQNVGHTPVSSPLFWQATSASAAINNGKGFLGTDIGRLVRLFSEPNPWLIGTGYTTGQIVAYNPSGVPGASTYLQALANSTGVAPGSNLTSWQIIPQGAALWTWGKIVSLSTAISGSLAGSLHIGDMTIGGGLAASFDSVFAKAASTASLKTLSGGFAGIGSNVSMSSFVGQNYSGATAQKIQQVTVYPSDDDGIAFGNYNAIGGGNIVFSTLFTINLRGSATAPGSPSAGTLLGTYGPTTNVTSAIAILSSDQVTAWNYVWIEIDVIGPIGHNASSWSLNTATAQVTFFGPPGTGTSSGINVEILGPPLLYTNPVLTWRMGAYTAGTYPTCGIYNDGRLYLGGAIGNRFDACYANGIVGGTINFAPTDQYGVVSAANAISYTFNSKGVNQILWMRPDLQGVKAGTQKGEWLITAPTAGPISPLNISARNVTNHGSANVEPCDPEHTLVFVQRFARKLLEYFPDVFSGKFSAPNLADKAQHLTRAGVAELAYTSAATPIIWGRCTDGTWFGITYKRDSLASSQPPTFYAWASHTLGSGRIVESICAGPSVGGNLDALTMVTNDPTATNTRRVEILTDSFDEETPLASAWFLDGGVVPTVVIGATSVTLSGLPWANGTVVQAFASGLDLGDPGEQKPFADFTVTGGAITVNFGDGISAGAGRGLFTAAFAATASFVVGFTYNSDGQMVRSIMPADTGARTGPALAAIRRIHRLGALLSNTLGISFGTSFSALIPQSFKFANRTTSIPPLTTYSGVVELQIPDQPSYDGMLCWRVSRPLPATVAAISGNLETEDQ